jgi:hypothetical protein
VVEAPGLFDGQLDHFLGTGRQTDIAGYLALAASNDELHRTADLVEINAQVREYFGGNALPLTNQTEEKVLRTNVVVIEALRFLLSELEHFPSPLGEFVKPFCHSPVSDS